VIQSRREEEGDLDREGEIHRDEEAVDRDGGEDGRHGEKARNLYLKSKRASRKKRRRLVSKDKSKKSESGRLLDVEADGGIYSYSSLSDLQSSRSTLLLPEEEGQSYCTTVKGLLLAILSGVLFTVNNFVLVHAEIQPMDAIFVRGCVHVLILGLYFRNEVWGSKPGFMVLQGMMGALALTLALFSVTLIPVPDALTILFTSPLPTLLLSVILFKERLNVMKVVAMILLLVGVVLVCKPSFIFTPENIDGDNSSFYLGILLASLSSVLGGCSSVVLKYCKESPFGVLVFWVATSALCLSIVGQYLLPGCYILTERGQLLTLTQWGCLFGMAVAGLVAYLSLARALQLASPTVVNSCRSLEIVLSYGIQAALDNSLPDPICCSGAALVCLGIFLMTLQTWLDRPRHGYQNID